MTLTKDEIPEKVTIHELRLAAERYAKAEGAEKIEEADALYRLVSGILRAGCFYTYRDAVLDYLNGGEEPNPDDFD